MCVGAWVQCLQTSLGVDYVKITHPGDMFCKGDGIRVVLVFVPSNNGGYKKAPDDQARNDTYSILIAETT